MPGATSAQYSLTIRVEIDHRPGMLGKVASAIGDAGGTIGSVDLVNLSGGHTLRDITVDTAGDEHGAQIVAAIDRVEGAHVVDTTDRTLRMHVGGKIEQHNKHPLKTRDDLSMAYTPGVARVCMAIHADRDKAFQYTIKRNTVAVVSDGSAVLGLGDIGPEAAMPVMEGKCMLFKEFAGVDAFPICLSTKDPDEIVATVEAIAPGFGGINLEDISAPRCFEVEERLKASLDIPVFHDDQHGTAIVVLAALLNALKVVGKALPDVRIVMSGAGAAGMAILTVLLEAGAQHVVVADKDGVIHADRADLSPELVPVAHRTNADGVRGALRDALVGADVFIGVSAPNLLTGDDVGTMAEASIVFAMANPVPEVDPLAAAEHASVVATGRSDFPNQINNVLAFPGVFRGLLDAQSHSITVEMLLAAARALAAVVTDDELNASYIVLSVYHPDVWSTVAAAVSQAVRATGSSVLGDDELALAPAEEGFAAR